MRCGLEVVESLDFECDPWLVIQIQLFNNYYYISYIHKTNY